MLKSLPIYVTFVILSQHGSNGVWGAIASRGPSSSDEDIKFRFIPWGGRCRIPEDGDIPLPHEGCDETKGIICQKYLQGQYCGCPIESKFLSYDPVTGECRRKPGEHCVYVNVTSQPGVYENQPRHIKCHRNARCIRLSVTTGGTGMQSRTGYKEICECAMGYMVSRDRLTCSSITGGVRSISLNNYGQLISLVFLSVVGLGLKQSL